MDQLVYGYDKLKKLLSLDSYTLNKYFLDDMLDGGIVFFLYKGLRRRRRRLAFFPTVVMAYFGALGREDFKAQKAKGKRPVGLGKTVGVNKNAGTSYRERLKQIDKEIYENDAYWADTTLEY